VTSDLEDTQWEWSGTLDALVAAPAHHHLLLENERVRVLETRIEPGDATPVHTHRWPNVQYVLSGADFVRYDAEGV
jgi:quercetin dioxygenase-like cupin family protein